MKAIGFESITVNNSQVSTLTVPEHAIYCEIAFEASDIESIEIEARFSEVKDFVPTSSLGLPLTHLTKLSVHNINMQNFKVIGIKPSLTHILQVQYFG